MTRLSEATALLREDIDVARRHLLRGLCEALDADAGAWAIGDERVELGSMEVSLTGEADAGASIDGLRRCDEALTLVVAGTPGQRLVLRRAPGRVPFTAEEAGLLALVAEPSDWLLQAFAGEASRARSPLTPRLRETLRLLLTGLSEKQVADALRISQHTVHGYVKELYSRMRVSSRAELLVRCLA